MALGLAGASDARRDLAGRTLAASTATLSVDGVRQAWAIAARRAATSAGGAGTMPPMRCASPRRADVLGVATPAIAAGLGSFAGVGRRLEVKGEPRRRPRHRRLRPPPDGHRGDDRGGARARYPGRRLWAVYEPLTYHRTAAMLDAFADVLATADEVVIADIWAGRDPDTTITSAAALARRPSRARGRAPAAAPGAVEATADYLAARGPARATSCW